jgi:hypothetical protein
MPSDAVPERAKTCEADPARRLVRLLAGVSLDHPSARSDIACVDSNREAGWSVEAWRWLSTERTRDLARDESFRDLWRRFVVALGDEYVELRGEQVDRFLATPEVVA